MKPIIPLSILFPAGMLLLALSIALPQFYKVPDPLAGFLSGLAIGVLILSVAYKMKNRRGAEQA
jgi:hypothetical protein